ncbi:MAG: hypothetical protein HW376_1307 [candidate division NC10 bacterium]|nr:hypothetical protein [candidate division NC10 bacterium]
MAVRPRRMTADRMMAITTGLTPNKRADVCGSVWYRTYAHANPRVMAVAGKMKQRPATISPRNPARTIPM